MEPLEPCNITDFDPLTHELSLPAVALDFDEDAPDKDPKANWNPRTFKDWKELNTGFQRCFGDRDPQQWMATDLLAIRNGLVQCTHEGRQTAYFTDATVLPDYMVNVENAGYALCQYNGLVAFTRPKLWDPCAGTGASEYPGNAALSPVLTGALACVTKRLKDFELDWCQTQPQNPDLNVTRWPFSMGELNDVQLVVKGLAQIEEGLDDPDSIQETTCGPYIQNVDQDELGVVQEAMDEQEAEVLGVPYTWFYHFTSNPLRAVVEISVTAYTLLLTLSPFTGEQGIYNFWQVLTFPFRKSGALFSRGAAFIGQRVLPDLRAALQLSKEAAGALSQGRLAAVKSFAKTFVSVLSRPVLMIVPTPLLNYYREQIDPQSMRKTA